MLESMRPESASASKKKDAPPPPVPSEVRDLGEYRTVAPDGTIEIVKRRLVVYDSPYPCNTEANRALAEARRAHRDPRDGDSVAENFFTSKSTRSTVNKDALRKDLENQIALKKQREAEQKEAEAKRSAAIMQQAAAEGKAALEEERRRAAARKEEARKAYDGSCSRNRANGGAPQDGTYTSLVIGDGGAAAARSRELSRAATETQRQMALQRQQQAEEARKEKYRQAVAEAERQRREEAEHREAERRAKAAAQQKIADDLRRNRDQYLKQRAAESAREKAATASVTAATMNELNEREKRDAARRQQQKDAYAATARRDLALREEQLARKVPSRVVTREETRVMLRCPKSGRVLPPSAFNVPQRQ